MTSDERCRTQQAIADAIRRAMIVVDPIVVRTLGDGTIDLCGAGMTPPWLSVVAAFIVHPTLNDALRTVLAGEPFTNDLAPTSAKEGN
jgi:hypothetical protein